MLGRSTLTENSQNPLYTWQCGPHIQSGRVGQGMNIFPLPAFEQRYLCPPALSLVAMLTKVVKI